MKVLVATSEKYAGCMIESLLLAGHEVVAVVSPMKGMYARQHFGPRFWIFEMRGWSVLPLCSSKGIEFRVCSRLDDGAFIALVRQKRPDLLLVFGWPALIGDQTLGLFPFGGMNIHPSLLPKLRGPDPLFQILDRGENGFGVSFHRITQELDAGPLFHQAGLISGDGASHDQLYCRVLEGIFEHLPIALTVMEQHPQGRKQLGTPTFVKRFRQRDRILDPGDSADAAWRRSRACYSHHTRLTAVGDLLLTFTRCRTMPYRPLIHKTPGAIQRVGLFSLDINLSGKYVHLGGVRIWAKLGLATPFFLQWKCRPGQLLKSAKEVLQMAKDQGAI